MRYIITQVSSACAQTFIVVPWPPFTCMLQQVPTRQHAKLRTHFFEKENIKACWRGVRVCQPLTCYEFVLAGGIDSTLHLVADRSCRIATMKVTKVGQRRRRRASTVDEIRNPATGTSGKYRRFEGYRTQISVTDMLIWCENVFISLIFEGSVQSCCIADSVKWPLGAWLSKRDVQTRFFVCRSAPVTTESVARKWRELSSISQRYFA